MKKLILSLIVFASISASAQATSEDAYLKVTYLNYSSGKYSLLIQNKQAGCNPDFNITYSQPVSAISPNSKNNINENQVTGSSTVFYITAPYSADMKFTVTDRTICVWMGSNPVALTVKPFQSTLPVTLEYFNATAAGQGISFEWKTAMEENVSHFTIQRRLDSAWIDVATVSASGPQVYSLTVGSESASLLGATLAVLLLLTALKFRKVVVALLIISASIGCSKTNISEGKKPVNAPTMYRLAIVDNDNHISYSPIALVK